MEIVPWWDCQPGSDSPRKERQHPSARMDLMSTLRRRSTVGQSLARQVSAEELDHSDQSRDASPEPTNSYRSPRRFVFDLPSPHWSRSLLGLARVMLRSVPSTHRPCSVPSTSSGWTRSYSILDSEDLSPKTAYVFAPVPKTLSARCADGCASVC